MSDEKKKSQRLIDEIVPDDAREHVRAARKEIFKSIESLLPPGFIEHRRAARREMLLAVRSILDAAVKRLEETE